MIDNDLVKTIELEKTRTISRAAKGVGHLYVPASMIGKRVVGIVVKD